jgi:hypothetical protein
VSLLNCVREASGSNLGYNVDHQKLLLFLTTLARFLQENASLHFPLLTHCYFTLCIRVVNDIAKEYK